MADPFEKDYVSLNKDWASAIKLFKAVLKSL
jgi:hypothetical protein